MFIDDLVLKVGAKVADVCSGIEYAKWVRTKAVPVDISTELPLVWNLSQLMQHFSKIYGLPAFSSNNLFWRETEKPIQVISIPRKFSETNQTHQMLTLVNPRIASQSQNTKYYPEGCGAIGEANVFISRPEYVDIEAYVLETGITKTIRLKGIAARIASHEIDHLGTKVITDSSHVVALSSRTDNDKIRFFNVGLSYLVRLSLEEGKEPNISANNIYLILHSEKNHMFWQVTRKKEETPDELEYGKPLCLSFPNLPGVIDFLKTLPLLNYTSYNRLLKIPIKGLN